MLPKLTVSCLVINKHCQCNGSQNSDANNWLQSCLEHTEFKWASVEKVKRYSTSFPGVTKNLYIAPSTVKHALYVCFLEQPSELCNLNPPQNITDRVFSYDLYTSLTPSSKNRSQRTPHSSVSKTQTHFIDSKITFEISVEYMSMSYSFDIGKGLHFFVLLPISHSYMGNVALSIKAIKASRILYIHCQLCSAQLSAAPSLLS